VFVKERRTADQLIVFLNGNQDIPHIKSDILVGHSQMSQSKQQLALQKFHEGTVNLLVATSVAE